MDVREARRERRAVVRLHASVPDVRRHPGEVGLRDASEQGAGVAVVEFVVAEDHEQGGIERAGISIEQIQDADHRLSAEVLAHDRREKEIARVQDENGPAFRLEPFAKRPHAGEQ